MADSGSHHEDTHDNRFCNLRHYIDDIGFFHMRTLKHPSVIPPGGYFFKDPILNITFDEPYLTTLINKVIRIRSANKVDTTNLAEIIQDQICSRLPPDLIDGDPNAIRTPMLSDVNAKTAKLKQIAKRHSGELVVMEEEAYRRGEICSKCPFNIWVCCMSCLGIYAWLRESFHVKELWIDKLLHSCAISSTWNKAQIHLIPAVFLETEGVDKLKTYPDHCWKQAFVPESKEKPNVHKR